MTRSDELGRFERAQARGEIDAGHHLAVIERQIISAERKVLGPGYVARPARFARGAVGSAAAP